MRIGEDAAPSDLSDTRGRDTTDETDDTTAGDVRAPTVEEDSEATPDTDDAPSEAADEPAPADADPEAEPAPPDPDPEAEPAPADRVAADVAPARAGAAILRDIGAGIVGALPVLWVLGAVPWRTPTLLIENMFRGFVQCAITSGALNPVVMVCDRAGVPLGMYQLDGGLSYPLGGVFVRLGVDALAAWKLSVALLIVAGFAALFWLGRRLTGSVVIGAVLVALFGLGATMSARTWNWYWNIVAVALLPVVFAFLYVVFDRAKVRRLRPLLWPGAGVLASVLLISVEWQYAGLFATAVAIGAVGVLAVQRHWIPRQRALLAGGGVLGAAVVFALLRTRLTIAGVETQLQDSFEDATRNAIDLVSFVAPDGSASFLGHALALLGRDGMLVRVLTEGRQLWVAPYLGVLTLALLVGLYVRRRGDLERNPHCPPGYLPLLLAVTVTSILLSTGPVVHVAKLGAPDASFTSPLAFLWTSTPLRWIRYPWTWGFLTHICMLLTFAVVTPALLRRGRSWSPLAWVLGGLLFLEFASPAVLGAFASPDPSVSTAPSWLRVSSRQPAVLRFEAGPIPELRRALDDVDGTATLLPWSNTWITPYLATTDGASVRNVGIDRNIRQVEAAAPFTRHQLRDPTAATIVQMLRSGWTEAVVLLDHIPTGESIPRHDHQHLSSDDMRRARWIRRTERDLARAGHCLEPHSWFTVVTLCEEGSGEGARR